MAERILYKNSCNIAALIQLLTIHERNINRYLYHQDTYENGVNLLNNLFTNINYTIDISNVPINTSNSTPLLIYDNSINTLYLDQLKFGDISNYIYTTCPISRETFTNDCVVIRIKTCNHYFKRESFIPWLRQSSHCPYCRSNILEI